MIRRIPLNLIRSTERTFIYRVSPWTSTGQMSEYQHKISHLVRYFSVSSEMLASISILHSATTSKKEFASSKELAEYLESTTLVSGKKTLAFLRKTDRKLFSSTYSLSSQRLPTGTGETTSVVMQGIVLDLIEGVLAESDSTLRSAPFKVLDIGCGTGGITYGVASILHQEGISFKIVGADLDQASIDQAIAAKTSFPGFASNVDFGLVDGFESAINPHLNRSKLFEYLESDKNFNLIIFGIGITKSDLLTAWMINSTVDSTQAASLRLMVAPIFESGTQQGLTIISNDQTYLERVRTNLIRNMKFLGGSLPPVDLDSSAEFASLRIMPCFFSPVLYQNKNVIGEDEDTDADLTSSQAKLLSSLSKITQESGANQQPSKTKPLKRQTTAELTKTLSELELKFKQNFAARKLEKKDFGIKDIDSDPELKELLTLIQTVKRLLKSPLHSK